MKRMILAVGVLVATLASPAAADSGAVLDAQAANMRGIRQYSWVTTYRVNPADGNVVAVTAEASVLTTGRVNQAVVGDNLHAEAEEVWSGQGAPVGDDEGFVQLSEVAKLLYAYGMMVFDEQQGFLENAETSEGSDDMEGTTAFSGSDVLNDGDSVTLWVDSRTGLSRKLTFTTVAIDLPIEVTVNYLTLKNGAVVVGSGHVTLPGETTTVDFSASGYRFSN